MSQPVTGVAAPRGIRGRNSRAIDWSPIEPVVRELGVMMAARRFGLPYSTVYNQAREHGWVAVRRSNHHGLRNARGESIEAAASVENLKRRCQSCYQLTRGRCCHRCGAAA